jgi:hypothetical protein
VRADGSLSKTCRRPVKTLEPSGISRYSRHSVDASKELQAAIKKSLFAANWERLKSEIAVRKVRVVALDLPTSWVTATAKPDDFTVRMF